MSYIYLAIKNSWEIFQTKCQGLNWGQGRSQNLKEVHQNFTEVFHIDDVTANDVIQRNQHRKKKLSSIVITDVQLAS